MPLKRSSEAVIAWIAAGSSASSAEPCQGAKPDQRRADDLGQQQLRSCPDKPKEFQHRRRPQEETQGEQHADNCVHETVCESSSSSPCDVD